jgi:hypothetical protein
MNRFRSLGLISYNGRILVHKAALNAPLLDQLPERNAEDPAVFPGPNVLPKQPTEDIRDEQNRTAS